MTSSAATAAAGYVLAVPHHARCLGSLSTGRWVSMSMTSTVGLRGKECGCLSGGFAAADHGYGGVPACVEFGGGRGVVDAGLLEVPGTGGDQHGMA